jgi:multisubunit Na+/H+ antiporter MnhB subunit
MIGSATRSEKRWSWERVAAGGGLIVGVCTGIAMALHGAVPDNTSTPEEIRQYYVDHATKIIVGHVFYNIAVIAFFAFSAALWRRLREVEEEPAWLSAMTLSGGVAFAILFAMGNVFWGTAGNMARDYPEQFTPAVALELFHFGIVFFIAWIGLNVMQLATAVLIFRTRVFPAWVAWLGLVDFVLFMVTQWPIPRHSTTIDNIVFDYSGPTAFGGAVLWVLTISVMLTFGRRNPGSAAATAGRPGG